jgi:hypothetical protein
VSLRRNANEAYLIAINHEAEDASTRVSVIKPDFGVTQIQNLAEGHTQQFHIVDGRIVLFDIQVPRERPQLLRLTQ